MTSLIEATTQMEMQGTAEHGGKARPTAQERINTRSKVDDPGSTKPPISQSWMECRNALGPWRAFGLRHVGMLIFALAFAALGAVALAAGLRGVALGVDWIPVPAAAFVSTLWGLWNADAPKRMRILEKARSKGSLEAQTRFLHNMWRKRVGGFFVFAISIVVLSAMAYMVQGGHGLLAWAGAFLFGLSFGAFGMFVIYRFLYCEFCHGYMLFFRDSKAWICSRCESGLTEGHGDG